MRATRRYSFPHSYVALVGLALFISGLIGVVSEFIGWQQTSDALLTPTQMTQLGFIMFLLFSLVPFENYRVSREIVRGIKKWLEAGQIPDRPRNPERPAYLLADSTDREILETISFVGGNIAIVDRILFDQALLQETDELERRLAWLVMLGLVEILELRFTKRLFLTPRGLKALNAPAALFISEIPDGVWQWVFQMKLKLREKEWSGVAIAMCGALETMLRMKLELVQNRHPRQLENTIAEVGIKKPMNQWTVGTMLGALRKLSVVQDDFEDSIIGELVKMRNKIHPPKACLDEIPSHPFGPKEAAKIDMYMDILLRLWYSSR